MTRILLVTTDYAPLGGGIARLLGSVVRLTDHDWRIVTSAPGPEVDGVVRSSSVMALTADAFRQRRWLADDDEALVISGHLAGLGAALPVARATRSTLGTIVHGRELIAPGVRHRVARALLRRSDRVIAVSSYTAATAVETGVRSSVVRVVRPVFLPPWVGAARAVERRVGQPLDLVMLTRLSEVYKNVDLVLRLARALMDTGVLGRVTIVGDGPRRETLQARARRLGVDGSVRFLGFVPDYAVPDVLARAHVALFPSRASSAEGFEGFGLVVQELAAAGLPVLVANAAGAVDAADPRWSMLLDPDDLGAWIDAVCQLHGDEPARLAMAEAAAAWATDVDPRRTAEAFVDAVRS